MYITVRRVLLKSNFIPNVRRPTTNESTAQGRLHDTRTYVYYNVSAIVRLWTRRITNDGFCRMFRTTYGNYAIVK